MNPDVDIAWYLDTFHLQRGSCVSLIGAGGKTTTMLALARVCARAGMRTVVSTTTKIWPPEGIPLHLTGADNVRALCEHLSRQPLVALGRSVSPEGKVLGVAPNLLGELLASGTADVVLCEADGAAGRSLKVHGPGEPVIPGCSTVVAVVAGMDAVGRTPGADVIHRLEEFERLHEDAQGSPVTPGLVADILVLAGSHASPDATVVYVLNKVDGDRERSTAWSVAEGLHRCNPDAAVVFASQGRLAAGTWSQARAHSVSHGA